MTIVNVQYKGEGEQRRTSTTKLGKTLLMTADFKLI